MKFDLEEAINVLGRTPATVRNMLQDLPETWTHQNEGGDTWSPFDIVGHLIHGEETDWVVRSKIILGNGDKSFTPFDRFAQIEASKGKTLVELLDTFDVLRRDNIEELKALNIKAIDLDKTGIHPEFGDITLKELLSAWVTHDLGHISQICRVLAKNYKIEAGPWPKYIAILNS